VKLTKLYLYGEFFKECLVTISYLFMQCHAFLEVTEGWKTLCNEESHNLFLSQKSLGKPAQGI
jgi:hypothetical protein